MIQTEGAPSEMVWRKLRACGVRGCSRRPCDWRGKRAEHRESEELAEGLTMKGECLDVHILF